ncbi:hypothetical protein [Nocardia amikacinitolerans]|uniref:hypothetical protein n=1 Tax=Nocardia amikacinitolerans TaxID=756689 RepID=UPI0020A5518E|nr:hypothetical protein [Nocardia amikacinitolerans]MCP2290158.1 hypothetical protein [Nocardia amikacinitolerans]
MPVVAAIPSALVEGDVRAPDGGLRKLPQDDIEIGVHVQTSILVAIHVLLGGRFDELGQPASSLLVRSIRRLGADRLPVDQLDLAAEVLGQVAPDVQRDRFRLQVLGLRPVEDRGHVRSLG